MPKQPVVSSSDSYGRRPGSGDVKLQIDLELDSRPTLWILSEPLRRVTSLQHCSRTDALSAVWSHIRLHELQVWPLKSKPMHASFRSRGPGLHLIYDVDVWQEPNGQVRCDGPLQALFGEEKVAFSGIAERVERHLTKTEPYRLEYTVRHDSFDNSHP